MSGLFKSEGCTASGGKVLHLAGFSERGGTLVIEVKVLGIKEERPTTVLFMFVTSYPNPHVVVIVFLSVRCLELSKITSVAL